MNLTENQNTSQTVSGSDSKQETGVGTNRQEFTKQYRKPEEPTRPVKITKRLLLESGVHFGHKTRDWNPKAFKYLYGIHNDIHVINLSQTLKIWMEVRQRIIDTVASGMDVLFVGTKKQASQVIREEAINCGQHYVDKKWKGGTLTNLKTMRKRVERLEYLEKLLTDEDQLAKYVKKEKLAFEKERDKLDEAIGGIRKMTYYPGLLFVVDTNKEKIAVNEAKKLGIPVLGFLDSNCNPDDLDFFIPANDDAYKSVRLFTSAVADAILEGKQIAAQQEQTGFEENTDDLTYEISASENITTATGIDPNGSSTTALDPNTPFTLTD